MVKGFRKVSSDFANGTGLEGYVNTTYRKLVSRFGKPMEFKR